MILIKKIQNTRYIFSILLCLVLVNMNLSMISSIDLNDNRDQIEPGSENSVGSIGSITRATTDQGTTFYMDSSNGNDENNGTSTGKPWKTVEKLNLAWGDGLIEKGDNILFKRGENFTTNIRIYPRTGGTPPNPMVIGAYGEGQRPILSNIASGSNGKTIQGSHMDFTGHYIFQDLNISGCSDDGISLSDLGVHNITIRRVSFYDIGGYGVLLRHVNNFKIENCDAYDIGVSAFLAHGSFNDQTRNGKFWNLTIRDCGVDGIVFHTRNDDYAYVGSNHWIENVTITECGEAGIDITFGHNPRANLYVHNVEIWNCNQAGIAAGHLTKYETFDNIYIHDVNNFLFGNTYDEHLILRNCVLEDWGHLGAVISQDKDGYSVNNVAYYNNAFISKGTLDFIKVIKASNGGTRDLTFKNNIFYSKTNSTPNRFIYYSTQGINLSNTNSSWSNNIYWRGDGGNSSDEWWYLPDEGYLSFKEWMANPEVSNEIRADPEFTNISSGNLSLGSFSPCIDAGDWLATTISEGSGNRILVENANYFMDGYDIDGLMGDEIFVGDNDPVRIIEVDYHRNIIIINRSISWEKGDPVNIIERRINPWDPFSEVEMLYGKPDIGPLEHKPFLNIADDPIDVSAPVRIFNDGSYRYLDAPNNGSKTSFYVHPAENSGLHTSHLVDIEFQNWTLSGKFARKWIEQPGSYSGELMYEIEGMPINTAIVLKMNEIPIKVIQVRETGEISFSLNAPTSSREFELVPVEEPIITDDLSSLLCYTGENYSIEVDIFDDVEVLDAWVEYWYDDEEEHFTKPLNWVSSFNHYEKFKIDIMININKTGEFKYIAHASDSDNNRALPFIRSVKIIDTIPPFLVSDLTNSYSTTGDEMDFRMILHDNGNNVKAFVEYWTLDRNDTKNLSMNGGPDFKRTIFTPEDNIVPISYRFHFSDGSDNWVTSVINQVEITDNDPPFIVEDRTRNIRNTIYFNIEVDDNIKIKDVHVEFWFYPNSKKNLSMTIFEGYSLVWDPQWTKEVAFYKFYIQDESGNWNHSDIREIYLVNETGTNNENELFIYRALIIVIIILIIILIGMFCLIVVKQRRYRDKERELHNNLAISSKENPTGGIQEEIVSEPIPEPVEEDLDPIVFFDVKLDYDMKFSFSEDQGMPDIQTEEEIFNDNFPQEQDIDS